MAAGIKGSLLVMACLTIAVMAIDEKVEQPETVAGDQPSVPSSNFDDDSRDFLKSKAFLASYRTITRTGVSLVTSTVFATCLSGFDGASVCSGRKKRSALPSTKLLAISDAALSDHQFSNSLLDSSQSEDMKIETMDEEAKNRLVGGVFTIWSTATTRTTVTTRYTNTATTISLSYYCTVRNMDWPAVFC